MKRATKSTTNESVKRIDVRPLHQRECPLKIRKGCIRIANHHKKSGLQITKTWDW